MRCRGTSRSVLLARMAVMLPVCALAAAVGSADVPASEPSVAPPAPSGCVAETEVRESEGARTRIIGLNAALTSYALPRSGAEGRDLVLLLSPFESDPEEEALKAILRDARDRGELARILATDGGVHLDTDRPQDLEQALARVGIDLDESPGAGCTATGPALFRLRPEPSPIIEPLAVALPEGTDAILALDLDEDGRDELLAQAQGAVYRLAADGVPPSLLFRDADLRLQAEEPEEVIFPPEPLAVRSPLDDAAGFEPRRDNDGSTLVPVAGPPLHLRVSARGRLRFYGPGDAGGPWSRRGEVELPSRSAPNATALLLAGPQVRTVGRNGAGALVLAAGPAPYGDQRLRTVLIEISDIGSPVARDVWSRLEAGDVIDDSGLFMLDGEAFMWLATDNEARGGVFSDRERLLFFRLGSDRSRAGLDPLLAYDDIKDFMQGRLKQGRDVNGDGRDDLLLVGRDGGLVLSALLQDEEGRFRGSWRRQTLPDGGRPIAFDRDANGDGRPDLLVRRGPLLEIYLGASPSVTGHRLRLVEERPAWSAILTHAAGENDRGKEQPVPCRTGDSALLDLNGDGLGDWICAGQDRMQRGWLTLVRLSRPQAAQAQSAAPSSAASPR